MEQKGTWGTRWGFLQKFSVRPGLGEVEGCMFVKYGWTPARLCDPILCWKSGMDPSWVILEEFWLETGIMMCSGHQMEVWSGGN